MKSNLFLAHDRKLYSGIFRQDCHDIRICFKTGAGFYDYSGDKADQAIRERDRLYIALAKVLYY